MKTHCAMEACIEGIRCGCLEAIEVMKKRGEAAAADQPYTPGSGGVREEDIAYFKACVDVLVGHLTRIASVGHYRHKRQLGLANKVYFDSLEVRICAVLRAVYKKRKKKKKQKKRTSEKFLPPNLIIQLASELSVWEPLVERVLALWIRKDRGGFRLICAPDPKRRAQQIILRDVILMLGIDNEFDYTRKGAGGERAFRDEVIKNLCGGYGHWWTPDVRDCFGSLKPGHFSWLPLDRRLMRNVVYLPRCAEIEVKRPEDPGAVLQYLKKAYPDLLVDESLTPYEAVVHLTQHLVRQGLPLGSCLWSSATTL